MKQFHKAIFFTKAPLGGYYRYKDVFQIFPMNFQGTPESRFQRHYPNILEYWTDEEDKINHKFGDEDEDYGYLDNLASLTATTTTKQDRILQLLSAFTNNLFFRYKDSTGSWGMPMLSDEPDDEINASSSKWSIGLFYFPEMASQMKLTDFSEPSVQHIQLVDYPDYYLNNPHLDSDWYTEITFPAIIDYLLDSYFSLPKHIAKIIDTAIAYTVSAVELNDHRKTLSLLASFTSLETMVNLEYTGFEVERCRECGQPKYSISKKFREFLLKYMGDSEENKKKFNKYYSLRSKIVHTGEQLKTEILFTEVEKNIRNNEFITRIEILQLGRLAIINWLLENY